MRYGRYGWMALAGLVIVMAAAPLLGKAPHAPGLMAWYRLGIEEVSRPALMALFVLGFGAGWLSPERPKRLGMSCVVIFPLVSIVEMILDPTSHNLWPFEFGMYAFWGLVCAAGAVAGSWLRRKTHG